MSNLRFFETVLSADFMPKTTYFWHPVLVKLWPFFEFQVSSSETAMELLTVSREFSKCRLSRVKLLKNFFFSCTKLRIFAIWKWKLCFFSLSFPENLQNWKKTKRDVVVSHFLKWKKKFLQVCKNPIVYLVFFYKKFWFPWNSIALIATITYRSLSF